MARAVPSSLRDIAEHVRILATAINGVLDGRQNNIGSVTLATGAASTVVSDRRVGVDSVVTFMPTTANAAAELGNGTMYVSALTQAAYTITHTNNAQADRTFKYEVTG